MLAHYAFVYNRKKKRLKRDEKALVQLRIWTEGKARYHSTGIYIEARYWSGKEPQWVVGCPNAKDYNDLLFSILTKVRASEVEAIRDNQLLSHKKIHNAIKGESVEDFIGFMRNEITDRRDITNATRKQHNVACRRAERYGLLHFSDLTIESINRINNDMLERYNISTLDKFHATLASYIHRAIKLDLFPMDRNPYLRFKRKRPKYIDRKFLTSDELISIEEKKMPVERLEYIRDLFIFSCYTGLSWTDLQSLRKSNIVQDGRHTFIKTFREKTDERASILLLPKAASILAKYESSTAKCFPYLSNQNANAYLKEIAAICGIDKNLTCHVARHTFATTVMLAKGVSLEVVQKTLGHASIKTTQIYAKMVDSRIAEEMERLGK